MIDFHQPGSLQTLVLLVFILLAILIILLYIIFKQYQKLSGYKDNLNNEARRRIDQSRSVLLGQLTEHMAPLLPDFLWNAKDARFLGQPIDYVVFDGLAQGGEVKIIFVEVKTGKSRLNPHEKAIADAVKAGRISFEILRPNLDKDNT